MAKLARSTEHFREDISYLDIFAPLNISKKEETPFNLCVCVCVYL